MATTENVTLNIAGTIRANEGFLAECGIAVDGHGFSEDQFGDVNEDGWNGLARISAVTLLNIAEYSLSEKFRATFGDLVLDVWTFVNGDGIKTARACPEDDQTIATEFGKEQDLRDTICEWFALCDHTAVARQPHPTLGSVPICKRCKERLARM
jgi:hypothetical protein